MVFGFGVWGPSGDRCNTGHGVRAGADLIYIVSVVSLSLRRLTLETSKKVSSIEEMKLIWGSNDICHHLDPVSIHCAIVRW